MSEQRNVKQFDVE